MFIIFRPVEYQPIDLELPYVEQNYTQVVSEVEAEPPVKKFKEKVVQSLSNDEIGKNISTSFKKRKVPNSRNSRRRDDDDD